jgi:nicotinamide-nucleotide amidase
LDKIGIFQRMPTHSVELLTIGTELLLGQIADTNARVIAKALCENGFDLCRITTIADDHRMIADAVRQATDRSRVLLITGGLGPTVDDPTRAAVAEAAGTELDFHPELWEKIEARFQKFGRIASDNNRAQAFLPRGAVAIPNPVGTAPGFALETGAAIIIAMPGVPAEMEIMLNEQAMPLLQNKWNERGVLQIRQLHVGGLGESQIDERIGEWERSANPVVGLAAHCGLVDVRIAARGTSQADAMSTLTHAETDIRAKLAGFIFGVDGVTLAEAVLRSLPPRSRLATLETGTAGYLAGQLESAHHPAFCGGRILPNDDHFSEEMVKERRECHVDFLLAARVTQFVDHCDAELIIESSEGASPERRSYAMAKSTIPEWAANHLLFRFWQVLQNLV